MASELVLEARRQIFRVKFLRCFKNGVDWFLRQEVNFFVWDRVLEKSVKNGVRTGS